VGYYTLVFGQVSRDIAPPRIAKGLPRYPVPIMVLARLAVAGDWQRRGIGSGMLKDAILRTLRAAEIAGLRALVVHAKDEAARTFYERFDFVPSPSDPLHLFVLIKDLKRILGK
jgi:GNAT superfamily N-acetyltransferase